MSRERGSAFVKSEACITEVSLTISGEENIEVDRNKYKYLSEVDVISRKTEIEYGVVEKFRFCQKEECVAPAWLTKLIEKNIGVEHIR